MELSRYLTCYPVADQPGWFLVYSTRKGSLVRLPEKTLEAARLGTLSAVDRATLLRLEILVENADAERADMEDLVRRANARRTRFKATVILNLDCNLACPYCYEDHYRGKKYLSDQVARQTVEHLVREQVAKGHEVRIGFYGGEPLLSVGLIRQIAGPVREAARLHGVKFSFGLTTNGTLL